MSDTQQATSVESGSEEYNQLMIDKYQNQAADAEMGNQPDPVPVTPMPDGGFEKFYNADTGEYNWENHAKELNYRLQNQTDQTEDDTEKADTKKEQEEQQAVNDIISQAGLNGDTLRSQLEQTGDLDDEAYAALERVGLPRDIVETYVENLNFRRESQINQALDYVGGDQAWQEMSAWGANNLTESEVNQYNELLATPEWRIAVDAMRVRMGDSAPNRSPEPSLVSGQTQNGSTFGYRSKSEMKNDMSDPRYKSDPAFRMDVMRKMQSATWDLDA